MAQLGEPLTPDLAGVLCAVCTCLDTADVVAHATVTPHRDVGLNPSDDTLVLELPVCAEHAHLLRMGVERFNLRTW